MHFNYARTTQGSTCCAMHLIYDSHHGAEKQRVHSLQTDRNTHHTGKSFPYQARASATQLSALLSELSAIVAMFYLSPFNLVRPTRAAAAAAARTHLANTIKHIHKADCQTEHQAACKHIAIHCHRVTDTECQQVDLISAATPEPCALSCRCCANSALCAQRGRGIAATGAVPDSLCSAQSWACCSMREQTQQHAIHHLQPFSTAKANPFAHRFANMQPGCSSMQRDAQASADAHEMTHAAAGPRSNAQ